MQIEAPFERVLQVSSLNFGLFMACLLATTNLNLAYTLMIFYSTPTA